MVFELLVLGVVIGANNFAASLALGALGQKARRVRIVAVFALFEFFIPLAGIWLGRRVAERFAERTEWIGPALLAAVGLWTIRAAWSDRDGGRRHAARATTWRGLVVLAALLSLDNLVVGFGLGMGGASPLLVATSIACFAIVFSVTGLGIGARAREQHRRIAEAGAGALLLALAAALQFGWL